MSTAALAAVFVLMGGQAATIAATPSGEVASDAGDPPPRVTEGVTHGSRWLVDVRDGSATSLPLTLRPVFASDYDVSPDRRRVVFTAPDAGGAFRPPRVYVAGVDGSDVRPITPSGRAARQPAWSPDGRAVVYVDDDGLAVQDLSSGRVRRFGRMPAGSIWRPGFSSDGRRVLFTRTYGPYELRSGLWTVPVRGGRARPLLEGATDGAWSPDGSRLAFVRRDNERATRGIREDGYAYPFDDSVDRHDVWIGDSRGRHGLRIGSSVSTSWSPDGRHLAMVGDDRVVRIVDTRTGRRHRLTCGWSVAWWDAHHVLVAGYVPYREWCMEGGPA